MDIVYYEASSLDGYIATAEGGVEWLKPFHSTGEGLPLFAGNSDLKNLLFFESKQYSSGIVHLFYRSVESSL